MSYYVLSYVDVEEEETVDKAAALSKTQPKDGDEMKDGAEAKVEVDEDEDEDEDDVQVPETMPEDAFFIPLGLVRQLPHTHYKGSDPEWQSFVEFGRDRERTAAVRSRSASTLFQQGRYLILYQRSWQTRFVRMLAAPKAYKDSRGYLCSWGEFG